MKPSERDVLAVIDMQNGFIEPRSVHVVPVVVDLVQRWTNSGGDVLFTRYLNYPGSPYTRLLGWNKMMSSPEVDIIPELTPYLDKATYVLDKHIYTLFTPEGDTLFQDQGWTDLYIIGVDTESCVAQTAVDSFERNLTPRVIVDGCASHAGAEAHDAGLLVMGRNIGGEQLITSAELGFHCKAEVSRSR